MGLFDEIKKSARDKANELVKSALEAADNHTSAVPNRTTNAEPSLQVNENDKEDVKLNELRNQLQSKLSELKRLECDSRFIKNQEKLQEKLDRVENLENEFSSLFGATDKPCGDCLGC
jgi:glutamine synthetase type III